MMTPTGIPQTYQQWLSCLQYLQEHPGDSAVCALIAQGQLPGGASDAFKARLSDTVSVMLSYHCRRFLRQLDQALAEGEADMVPLLAARLRRSIQSCLVYRNLAFLDASFVALLEEGYTNQLQSYWSDLQRQLRRTARESMNPELEDLVLVIRKIRIL